MITLFVGLASSLTNLSVITTNAQLSQFPNELPDYEFFGKGKLNTIEFGKSKNEDIKKIFGETCEKGCDYDERFKIKIDYLSCENCMTTQQIRDRAMCPLNEFMGTIEKITLTPKILIRFDKVAASTFPKRTGGAILSRDGSGGASWESFSDEFGLKYSIKQSSTPKLTLTSPVPKIMDGELYSIEYGLSTELETRIFKAEYKSCMKQTEAN